MKKNSMEKHQYYRTLTRNMVLIVILVSFTPLVLISGLIGYHFEISYRQKVMAHLAEVVQKHQQSINIFLNEKLAFIRILMGSHTFEELKDPGFLHRKLENLQRVYGREFVDLGVVDSQGIQVAYAGKYGLEGANYLEAGWFQKAIQRQYYVSDVFLGLRRHPHFIIAVRETSEQGEWLLRATIEFDAFNALVENIHVGETGSAFILNADGEFQTKARQEYIQTKGFFLSLLAPESAEELIVRGAPERARSPESLLEPEMWKDDAVVQGEASFHGRDFIYVMTPLKSGEWMLALQQDTDDAFSDLLRARKLAIMIFSMGGFAIVLMAFVLSKRMVRRIERADHEKDLMNEQMVETGKLASVGELAAGIAHEINNPLAVMVEEAGWIEDLLEEEEFNELENLEELRRSLKQIKVHGVRCREITHKLLSFAKRTDPKLREINLNDLIEEVIAISEQSARYGHVKVQKHLAPELPTVYASPSEMEQVLLNLINNAMDAIGTKGGHIEVTSRVEGDYAVVGVADSGCGIPEAVLARIFDPFFTTKPVGRGTGLGLSICYGILKKMGGEISVNSAVGVGTTFHVYVPIPEVSSERHETATR